MAAGHEKALIFVIAMLVGMMGFEIAERAQSSKKS
jgi:hypothetical protein